MRKLHKLLKTKGFKSSWCKESAVIQPQTEYYKKTAWNTREIR